MNNEVEKVQSILVVTDFRWYVHIVIRPQQIGQEFDRAGIYRAGIYCGYHWLIGLQKNDQHLDEG